MQRTLISTHQLKTTPVTLTVVQDRAWIALNKIYGGDWIVEGHIDDLNAMFKLCFTTSKYYPDRIKALIPILERIVVQNVESSQKPSKDVQYPITLKVGTWNMWGKRNEQIDDMITDLKNACKLHGIKLEG